MIFYLISFLVATDDQFDFVYHLPADEQISPFVGSKLKAGFRDGHYVAEANISDGPVEFGSTEPVDNDKVFYRYFYILEDDDKDVLDGSNLYTVEIIEFKNIKKRLFKYKTKMIVDRTEDFVKACVDKNKEMRREHQMRVYKKDSSGFSNGTDGTQTHEIALLFSLLIALLLFICFQILCSIQTNKLSLN